MEDPRHPLYGRRFSVAYRNAGISSDEFVFVHFRDGLIRLPATTVLPKTGHPPATKLTSESIGELLTAARACGLCESIPIKSGRPSRTPSQRQSKRTSRGSSGK